VGCGPIVEEIKHTSGSHAGSKGLKKILFLWFGAVRAWVKPDQMHTPMPCYFNTYLRMSLSGHIEGLQQKR